MLDHFATIFVRIYEIYSGQLPILFGLAVLFSALTVLSSQACNPGAKWWQNPGLPTDIWHALGIEFMAPYLVLPAIILVHTCLTGFMSPAEVKAYFENGRGPLSGLSFWWQVPVYLLASDFLAYWMHRIFHGVVLWRFHAVHHSSVVVDWTSTYRFHPVNVMLSPCLVGVAMLSLGISPKVVAFLVPWEVLSSAFVHANLNWTFGPFKYVLSSPVFHRWHHGPANDGGSSNFAPTFAFYDWIFGTFHMPEGRLPAKFGVDDPNFPQTYLGQLVYPFKPQPQPELTPQVPMAGDTAH